MTVWWIPNGTGVLSCDGRWGRVMNFALTGDSNLFHEQLVQSPVHSQDRNTIFNWIYEKQRPVYQFNSSATARISRLLILNVRETHWKNIGNTLKHIVEKTHWKAHWKALGHIITHCTISTLGTSPPSAMCIQCALFSMCRKHVGKASETYRKDL